MQVLLASLLCNIVILPPGAEPEAVLAALFHDLGHFCIRNQQVREKLGLSVENMGEVGIKNHEVVGATYLRQLGTRTIRSF